MAKSKSRPRTGDLYRCRQGHLSDGGPAIHFGGSQLNACKTCLYAWLHHEFGVTEVLEPSVLAAYELGGLEAAQDAAGLRKTPRLK